MINCATKPLKKQPNNSALYLQDSKLLANLSEEYHKECLRDIYN